MIKHFCEVCGKEIENLKELVRADVKIRFGHPKVNSYDFEYHINCVDKAFGEGFSEKLIESEKRTQQRVAERKAEREAMRKEVSK